MCLCTYDWVTLLYNRKLTEHCKPAVMEKNKNKKNVYIDISCYYLKKIKKRSKGQHFIPNSVIILRSFLGETLNSVKKCLGFNVQHFENFWQIYFITGFSALFSSILPAGVSRVYFNYIEGYHNQNKKLSNIVLMINFIGSFINRAFNLYSL